MAVAAALLAGSCNNTVSYVVLTLQSADPAPITGVTQVEVQVFEGTTKMKTLTYDHAALTIDQVTATTLSVSFGNNESGSVSFLVSARNDAGCTIGSGTSGAVIKRGARADATVSLAAMTDCSRVDGGAADGPDAGFPGCEPVGPSCPANMTCQINCVRRVGECTTAGTGAPGTPCQMNRDCMPGTQCFDYSGTGCAVKLCLRFCNTQAQCTQPGDGGVGPGSFCQGPVQCNGSATAYHTCTFSCDPRRVAVNAGTSGCPTGLSCLVVGNMDQVDCACPEPSRTKMEGEDCSPPATNCAPGLICNLMGGTQKCRAVCRCDAQGLACTSSQNDCPTAGTHCTALTNDTIYGVCI